MTWWQTYRGWPRAGRLTADLVGGLVLLLIATTAMAALAVRRPVPEVDGEVELAGLSSRVEVVRDSHGIPQIYADTASDLMMAQGFVHAQDRFWEMDVRRHLTAGRMSELFGEATLDLDKTIRTMGWRQVAEAELALVSPDTRRLLEAYAQGVNAYLATHGPTELSLEYTMLRVSGFDYEPEPWSPVDSLAWLKAMAWDLRSNMEEEIQRVLLSVNHTPSRVAQLYPAYPYATHAPIVAAGAVVDGVFDQEASPDTTREPTRPAWTAGQLSALRGAAAAAATIPELIGRGEGIGSNSWVVDGEHSATGQPILANDPHLGVSQPGVWTQVGLHCRTVSTTCPYDVSGFSFSGVPGVVIGHNADIAWGMSNLYPDVTDLFLEKISGRRWWYAGRYRPLQIRQETIEVRDGEDFELTVRSTDHGPLISDVSARLSTVGANAHVGEGPPRGTGYAVSLAWTALTPSPTADAIFQLNAARDWDDFRNAARKFDVPAQNLVYADTQGHIGYQAPGRIPVRKSGNTGAVPSAGWLPENDWTGDHVPFDALPSMLDPEEGFIVAANQAVIGPTYPYHLAGDWDYGYRSQRIRDLLAAEGELSVEEMAELQLDTHNSLAPTLVPYLLDIRLGHGYADDGQQLLRDWDYTQPADSAPAAYFNVVWRNLLERTFHDELRESLWPDGGGRWWLVVTDLLRRPVDPWWDDRTTDAVETRDDVLRRALLDARDELTKLRSLDPERWRWGHLHRLNLRNATFGQVGMAPVNALLNSDGWEVGGGGAIVDATTWDAAQGYAVSAAPTMRMVVSMADLDDSRWINLTGVSGHPWSGHYTDQTELFVAGETLPWRSSSDAVHAAAEDTLLLLPAG